MRFYILKIYEYPEHEGINDIGFAVTNKEIHKRDRIKFFQNFWRDKYPIFDDDIMIKEVREKIKYIHVGKNPNRGEGYFIIDRGNINKTQLNLLEKYILGIVNMTDRY